VLPSYSPRTTAVTVLAPVVAWCLYRALADSLPAGADAAEAFDRLYLRSAISDAFKPLGLEGEAAWRAVARIRILFAKPGEGVAPSQGPEIHWTDSDVAWLTGLHEAQGHRYFNKESHEQLLWWLGLPELMAAAEKDPAAKYPATRKTLRAFALEIETALAAAAASGYRLDVMEQSEPTDEKMKSLVDVVAGGVPDRSS